MQQNRFNGELLMNAVFGWRRPPRVPQRLSRQPPRRRPRLNVDELTEIPTRAGQRVVLLGLTIHGEARQGILVKGKGKLTGQLLVKEADMVPFFYPLSGMRVLPESLRETKKKK